MRMHLLLAALVVGFVGAADVQGGIFSRGGGCANGSCHSGGGYAGGNYSGYYATTVAPSRTMAVAPAPISRPAVATIPPTQPAPQVTATTSTSNVRSASAPRGRFIRRFAR